MVQRQVTIILPSTPRKCQLVASGPGHKSRIQL